MISNRSDRNCSVQDHTYAIYTDEKTDFLFLRDQAIAEAGRSTLTPFAEFQYDTCIAQSDYLKLRELLGYNRLELDPSRCYVHCVPALEQSFKSMIEQQDGLEVDGYTFAKKGVFSEPFSQLYDYGNGSGCVIVVPDGAVTKMQIVYGVYAATTETAVSVLDTNLSVLSCAYYRDNRRCYIGNTSPQRLANKAAAGSYYAAAWNE